MIRKFAALALAWALSACASVAPDVSAPVRSTAYVAVVGGHGTGIVIAPGKILTAKHVVFDEPKIEVEFADGTKRPATVLWMADGETDAATIAVDTAGITPATVDCRAPRLGESVVSYGHPLSMRNVATFGRISNTEEPDGILMDLAIAPGNSGGGIWSADGKLIGIAVAIATMPAHPMLPIAIPMGISVMQSLTPFCEQLR